MLFLVGFQGCLLNYYSMSSEFLESEMSPSPMSYLAHFVASLTLTSLPILAPLCPHLLTRVLPLQSILSTHSTPQSPASLKLIVTTLFPFIQNQNWDHFPTSPFPLCTLNQSSSPLDHDHKDKVT